MNNTINLDKNNIVKPIIKGCIISVLITIILLFAYAFILTNTSISESTIQPTIITITAISILIGSSIGCIKTKKNGIVNGIAIGIIYFVVLYLLSGITGTGFSIGVKTIIMFISGIGLGGIGGIIGVNFK